MPLSLLQCPEMSELQTEPLHLYTPEELPDDVELLIPCEAQAVWNLEPDLMVTEDQMICFKVVNTKVKSSVISRDDELLTPEETRKHWPEVCQAMLKELQTWQKLNCFSRKLRKDARNIIDTRWVLKWKWEQPTVSVADSGSPQAKAVRIIRARLTIRGFKDRDKDSVDRYAGTSSKLSQKVLVSEAVARLWHLCTTDVSKAFLK